MYWQQPRVEVYDRATRLAFVQNQPTEHCTNSRTSRDLKKLWYASPNIIEVIEQQQLEKNKRKKHQENCNKWITTSITDYCLVVWHDVQVIFVRLPRTRYTSWLALGPMGFACASIVCWHSLCPIILHVGSFRAFSRIHQALKFKLSNQCSYGNGSFLTQNDDECGRLEQHTNDGDRIEPI